MKIRSTSDVITNSSSEVFIIKTSYSKEELKKILEDYHKANIFKGSYEDYKKLSREEQAKYDFWGSGMGGCLEVEDFDDRYQEHLKYIPKNKRKDYTKEMFAMNDPRPIEEQKELLHVDVDNDFLLTCDYIIQNFNVVEADGGYFKWSEDGEKILGRVDWKEWTKLPKIQQYGKGNFGNYDDEE